jgi:hypothetical protein
MKDNTPLGLAIVKGKVADYAEGVAMNNDVDKKHLADILEEIAKMLKEEVNKNG